MYKTPIALILFFTIISSECQGWTRLFFRLQGRNLPNEDRTSDPFVKVYEQVNGKWVCFGRSETISTSLNPNWKTLFKLEHEIGTSHYIKIEVRDHDPANPDDAMGEGYFYVENTYPDGRINLNKGGYVVITPEFLDDDEPGGSCLD